VKFSRSQATINFLNYIESIRFLKLQSVLQSSQVHNLHTDTGTSPQRQTTISFTIFSGPQSPHRHRHISTETQAHLFCQQHRHIIACPAQRLRRTALRSFRANELLCSGEVAQRRRRARQGRAERESGQRERRWHRRAGAATPRARCVVGPMFRGLERDACWTVRHCRARFFSGPPERLVSGPWFQARCWRCSYNEMRYITTTGSQLPPSTKSTHIADLSVYFNDEIQDSSLCTIIQD
jgi:hypothetical protein